MTLAINLGQPIYTINSKAPVLFGIEASLQTGATAASYGWRKVMFISDEGVKATGIAAGIVDNLKAAGMTVVEFYDILPDPLDTAIEKAARLANAEKVDGIIAVGGGSVLDTAKGVNFLTTNEFPLKKWYLFEHPPEKPGKGMILIPTTAGTGSEISVWAVVTDSVSHVKTMLFGPNCLPRLAIVDPGLTMSMPRQLTVQTGLDAFSHCFESYTSRAAIPLSELLALEGMKLIVQNLPLAARNGSDMDARKALSLAAVYASMAFNDASIHIGHAMALSIGAATHIAHGISCAISTSICLEYLSESVPEKIRRIGEILGASLTDNMSPAAVGKATRSAWDAFCRQMGMPTTLTNAGNRTAGYSGDYKAL